MIIDPSLLASIATKEGIKVPEIVEYFDTGFICHYEPASFPHWHTFCMSQLGAPMPYVSAPEDNARIIASLSEDVVKSVTFDDLEKLGCVYNNSYYYP